MNQLALLGGVPVIQTSFPSWPIFDQQEAKAVREVAASGVWDTKHPVVTDLETQFAAFQETRHGLAVTNGSQTMEIILRALGIGVGDEVIVPAFTFLATATAVLMVGAIPIIVDIHPETFTLLPEAVQGAITSRTRAIMAVHIAGVTGKINEILQIASKHKLYVIEDCAHAHGSKSRGRPVGTLGDAGSFSFQGGKVITAGEGGMIVTNSTDLHKKCLNLREGRQENISFPGTELISSNYRITAFQAAVILVQFQRFQSQVQHKLQNINWLDTHLGQIDGIIPQYRHPEDESPGYLYMFYYNAQAFNGLPRYLFVKALEAEGIPCGEAGYPPLYKTSLFRTQNFAPGGGRMTHDWSGHPFPEYSSLSLPNVESVTRDVVIFPHANLLAKTETIQCIPEAVLKIQDYARKWPKFANEITFGGATLSQKILSKAKKVFR